MEFGLRSPRCCPSFRLPPCGPACAQVKGFLLPWSRGKGLAPRFGGDPRRLLGALAKRTGLFTLGLAGRWLGRGMLVFACSQGEGLKSVYFVIYKLCVDI